MAQIARPHPGLRSMQNRTSANLRACADKFHFETRGIQIFVPQNQFAAVLLGRVLRDPKRSRMADMQMIRSATARGVRDNLSDSFQNRINRINRILQNRIRKFRMDFCRIKNQFRFMNSRQSTRRKNSGFKMVHFSFSSAPRLFHARRRLIRKRPIPFRSDGDTFPFCKSRPIR